MDFISFCENPTEYINNIAQVSDTYPDFGINAMINDQIKENPELLSKLPLITSNGDLLKTSPGQLARFRVTLVSFAGEEYIPLKLKKDNTYYTPIIEQDIPVDVEPYDPHKMVKRTKIIVSSIQTQTKWLREKLAQYNEEKNDEAEHLSIDISLQNDNAELYDEPYQAIARFLFDMSDKPFLVVDLIGIIDQPYEFHATDNFDNMMESYFSTLPSIVAFGFMNVDALYSPILKDPTPSFHEIREKLLEFLSLFFTPTTAEIIILWLVGKIRARVGALPIGTFSLNLTGANPEIASCVIQILGYLCSSLSFINLNCEELNKESLVPILKDLEFKTTPLSVVNETRIIINETTLKEGHLNEVGFKNLQYIQNLVETQTLTILYEIYEREIEVSYPILIISSTKSLLKNTNVCIDIGDVKSVDITPDQDLIDTLRLYVEIVRNNDFVLEGDDVQRYVESQIIELMRADSRVNQLDLHLLLILNQLNSISHGATTFSKEIWNNTVDIFKYIIANKN